MVIQCLSLLLRREVNEESFQLLAGWFAVVSGFEAVALSLWVSFLVRTPRAMLRNQAQVCILGSTHSSYALGDLSAFEFSQLASGTAFIFPDIELDCEFI